jgi:hypothetical protein
MKKLSSLLSSMADDLRNAGIAEHETELASALANMLDDVAAGAPVPDIQDHFDTVTALLCRV